MGLFPFGDQLAPEGLLYAGCAAGAYELAGPLELLDVLLGPHPAALVAGEISAHSLVGARELAEALASWRRRWPLIPILSATSCGL